MTRDDRGMTCAEVRERLPLRFYETPAGGEDDPVARHLAACPGCAADWEATRRVLASVRAVDAFPREGEVDWEAFARATAGRARAAERAAPAADLAGRPPSGRGAAWRSWRSGRLAIPAGLLAAAAALVAVVALRVERGPDRDPVGDPQAFAPAPQTAEMLRQSVARQAATRSLRDGRALLVDLMQAPVRCRRGDGTLDLALEKERSRDLLRRLAVHGDALTEPEDARLADLMGQMESLLLQVGTLEDCAGPHSLDEVRAAIRRRQILLRIDLVTRDAHGGTSRA